jgi:hypothetical protein
MKKQPACRRNEKGESVREILTTMGSTGSHESTRSTNLLQPGVFAEILDHTNLRGGDNAEAAAPLAEPIGNNVAVHLSNPQAVK